MSRQIANAINVLRLTSRTLTGATEADALHVAPESISAILALTCVARLRQIE